MDRNGHNMLLVCQSWLQIPLWISASVSSSLSSYHTLLYSNRPAMHIMFIRLQKFVFVSYISFMLFLCSHIKITRSMPYRGGTLYRITEWLYLIECVSDGRALFLSVYPECSELRCANGACYNRSQRCDQVLNCRDGSDEANCSECISLAGHTHWHSHLLDGLENICATFTIHFEAIMFRHVTFCFLDYTFKNKVFYWHDSIKNFEHSRSLSIGQNILNSVKKKVL